MPAPKAVVLLSGGMDSTTTAAIAQRRGFDVHALSIRYGQRHAIEIEAARCVAARLGIARHLVVDIDLRAFGGSALTGDLAVHEQQVGGVLLNITARDFKVIDNKMGNVRINSDVQIGGELRSPRVEGELSVETGSINLDEVIALLSDSAYATSQTEYLTKAEEARAQAAKPSPFDALKMDVRVRRPGSSVSDTASAAPRRTSRSVA